MKKIIISALLIASVWHIQAQGCSDAGLCSIDVLKPSADNDELETLNKLHVGLSVGSADYNISVFGGHLGYSRRIGKRWSLDTKLTFLSQSGNDISVAGPGDVFVNLNYAISQSLTLVGGVKIPLMKADKEYKDLPLPMDYQSSLGTFDLLAGVKYTSEKWMVTAAFQLPLEQNENEFNPNDYPLDSPFGSFQNTNEFNRQADVLLHLSRIFPLNDKITLTTGLLGIYHVAEDTFVENVGIIDDPVTYPISGSDGLTLNGTVFVDVRTGSSGSIGASLGFPFIVREARPDGLTRSFVFGVGYSLDF